LADVTTGTNHSEKYSYLQQNFSDTVIDSQSFRVRNFRLTKSTDHSHILK